MDKEFERHQIVRDENPLLPAHEEKKDEEKDSHVELPHSDDERPKQGVTTSQ